MLPLSVCRKFLFALCLTYAVLTTLLLLLLNIVGERFWLFHFLTFFPPTVWLAPAGVLIPVCFWVRRRLALIPLFVCAFALLYFVGWHWSFWPVAEKPTLSIVTNNIGGRKTRTLWPFLAQEKPDIFMYQEAWRHGKTVAQENPSYYVAMQGQFILASKYEIKNSGIVAGMGHPTGPTASWFEINFNGQPVVIYNVHMPTPRSDFLRLRGRGILLSSVRASYKQSVQTRLELSRQLLDVLKNEKRPYIVAGDFNMPDVAWLYREFTSEMKDSFAARGRGFGYTFPSVTLNPLSFFGPWLRLDYIFAGPGWQPIYCRVEPRQEAQHRAVSARLQLLGDK